jgi:steroid delta-isomerase
MSETTRYAHVQAPTRNAIDWFEGLTHNDVARMGQLYSANTYFKDPFNEVHHVREIQAIFEHMFKRLHQPRFVVTKAFDHHDTSGLACVLTWEFHFSVKADKAAKPWVILGASHLQFDEQGLIKHHRDYWDAAEELYERIPVLGALMRWLKRQATR